MSKKSILYTFPSLYVFGLRLYHGSYFDKRYRYMASFIDNGDIVLEPGCGPAILADYLQPIGAKYKGFDTNKDFLQYAKKRGKDVWFGNALEKNSYVPADVIVVVDVLHHLPPKQRERFLALCVQFAKKALIICEPGMEETKGNSLFDLVKDKVAQWSEQDGTNNFHTHYFYTKKTLSDAIQNGFGVLANDVKRKVQIFGQDLIVVFDKPSLKSH